jgi:hypothetical protein
MKTTRCLCMRVYYISTLLVLIKIVGKPLWTFYVFALQIANNVEQCEETLQHLWFS